MSPPAIEPNAGEQFCYVTTTGRVTGRSHEIEIWFGLNEGTLYMLSGGRDRSDWVRNILAKPQVSVRIGEATFTGHGRTVQPGTGEDALARHLLLGKYTSTYSGDLTDWGRTALPIAIVLGDVAGSLRT